MATSSCASSSERSSSLISSLYFAKSKATAHHQRKHAAWRIHYRLRFALAPRYLVARFSCSFRLRFLDHFGMHGLAIFYLYGYFAKIRFFEQVCNALRTIHLLGGINTGDITTL